MYSPEVFSIAQLLGELPSSILCAIIFWAIMVTRVQDSHRLNVPNFRIADLRPGIRSRFGRARRHRVPIGGHPFRRGVRRILGTIYRSHYAVSSSGHLVRPLPHGCHDHFLFVYFRLFVVTSR